MLKQALNCVQHLRLQPVMSAEGSSVIAVQMLPQERKSSLQTRTLWLLAEHGDIGARSDWKGERAAPPGAGSPVVPRGPIAP